MRDELYAPLGPLEQPSKLDRPKRVQKTVPITPYTCYKPSSICTPQPGQNGAVVEASLSRQPQPKIGYGIRRVTYSYHSSVSGTFNYLFKVLCIFPSLYLFAIGLRVIFRLRRGTPPFCSEIPNWVTLADHGRGDRRYTLRTGLSPSLSLTRT